jgi:hypothetical protein
MNKLVIFNNLKYANSSILSVPQTILVEMLAGYLKDLFCDRERIYVHVSNIFYLQEANAS